MKTKTVITANPTTGAIWTQQKDEHGNPLLDKNGEEYGFIRVSQPRVHMKFTYLNGGVSDTSAIIAMSKKAWEKVGKFYFPNMVVEGRVKIVETIDPAKHKNGEGTGFSAKLAGEGGEQLTKNGLPIFRKTEFSTNMAVNEEGKHVDPNTGAFDDDEFIQHENVIVRAKVEEKETLQQKTA